jgi:hypothetical protein
MSSPSILARVQNVRTWILNGMRNGTNIGNCPKNMVAKPAIAQGEHKTFRKVELGTSQFDEVSKGDHE